VKAEDRNPKSESLAEKYTTVCSCAGAPYVPAVQSWFNTEERIAKLQEVAASWIGTPFFSNGNTKGKGIGSGVSCQKLCEGIYRECGFIDVKTPAVQMSHAQFSSKSLVDEFMQTCKTKFAILQRPLELLPGDLIAIRIKKISHHLGVMVTARRFIQAVEGPGVLYSELSDGTWGSRLQGAWRPIGQEGANAKGDIG